MRRIKFVVLTCLWLALSAVGLAEAQTGNTLQGTAIASGAFTTTQNSADITNAQWKGGHFVLNISAFTSGTWQTNVQGKDPVSGNYYNICTGTAQGATGTTIVKLYPGIATATGVCSDLLPRTFRVQVIGASTPSGTLSVGLTLLP